MVDLLPDYVISELRSPKVSYHGSGIFRTMHGVTMTFTLYNSLHAMFIGIQAEQRIGGGSPLPIRLYLETIKTPRQLRRLGLATDALIHLCGVASRPRNQWIIYVKVEPFDDEPMTQRQLMRWYRKHGFKWLKKGWMRRVP